MIDLATIAFQDTDMLIYLGCGELQQLPDLLGKMELVLVDADSSTIEQLEARYRNKPNVKCLHRFISLDGTKQNFNYFNLNLFNGFGGRKGVEAFYPGIKLRESETVNTIDVTDIIDELGIESNQNNLLFLDIPSLNAQLLRRLKDSGQLYHFQTVKVCQQIDYLFEGENCASELALWFSDNGFLAQQESTADADFVLITAQINPLLTVNKRLQYELETKSKKLNESEQKALKNEQMLADVTTRQAELENQLSQKDSEINRNRTELKKQTEFEQKRIADEASKITKLESERSDLLKQIEEKDKGLEKLAAERDIARSERDSARVERDNLKSQEDYFAKQIAAKTNLLNNKLMQLNELQKHLAKLERENKRVFSEKAIHQMSLTKAEAQLEIIKDLLIKPKAQQ